ncbi:PAS domain-containing sensor histidine kinase [Staphylococcus saprophyticus]|jgi:two-component system sensor histidine kinase VicK|uniref:cell wall metabolism sensor histidine kinase WalK n=1 Tax=Staphylococcus TaxID=1279 RepID=UPI0006458DD4|nr:MULTISPECIES: cell wall metabolism sensor histidine kinase WalK [Staphylococcus]SIN56676.1 integral membrane sensor signal transduction histidine kinase [Mycobacteroides abscessus subsp. abscessus]MBC2920332.1 cell wall metabolism sensor histidine kinase WalK [Staphylococcus saprophyticus]MBC2958231.1 cell wall metabolism sensor histidine kinase WalK [Staphylococcus saprophyticus]MBC3008257.1 cell wall metabolism sensor histidine kinase WalK [Staphylococcus saprophyticus]MBC3022652.1 cell w
MKWLKHFQSLHTKLVIVYVLLIIIGMQIIGLYFTNSLEKELTQTFKNNISQYAKQIEINIEKVYDEDNAINAQKEVQNLLNEYANRQEIEEIRFIDKDQIIMATSKQSTRSLINQKANDNSIQKALSLGEINSHTVLKDYGNGKQRVWVYNLPVKTSNDGTIGDVYIEADINDVYNQLSNINQIFIVGTGISLLITVILGFFIARTITKPITDMRNQTVEMSKGNYTQRVKIYGNDEIGELALAFNNLSKRVQEAQANTESEKRRLDSVITHMSDGIIATDRRGRVRIVNDMALTMMGTMKEDIIGDHMLKVLKLEEDFSLDEIQENNDSFLLDINENEGIIARVNFSTIVQETGFVTGYIAVLHDVTEQQQVERERREFVANVSHELRTPLTSMNSYIEALESGAWKDGELAPQFLSVTREETERMIRLVNDLLQLSKMDNESEQITKEIVDFNMFINKIINRHEMSAKDTTFVREIPTETIFTEIDPDKMTQVFDNVITNAMKYSRGDKRVEFHVKQNALYNRMTIRVKDNGIGIPINKVDKIFDRFYRVDKARTRKMGGTGLGLAISKEIVEAHNGRIWANSVEGQGTSIFITLPCEVLEDGDWDAE